MVGENIHLTKLRGIYHVRGYSHLLLKCHIKYQNILCQYIHFATGKYVVEAGVVMSRGR